MGVGFPQRLLRVLLASAQYTNGRRRMLLLLLLRQCQVQVQGGEEARVFYAPVLLLSDQTRENNIRPCST